MRQNLELFAPSGLKWFIGIKAPVQNYSLEWKVTFSLKNITFSIVLTKKNKKWNKKERA